MANDLKAACDYALFDAASRFGDSHMWTRDQLPAIQAYIAYLEGFAPVEKQTATSTVAETSIDTVNLAPDAIAEPTAVEDEATKGKKGK